MTQSPIKVLHISGFKYLPPSQTFVHARVLNPICQRPVPVITNSMYAGYEHSQEIELYQGATVHPFHEQSENVVYGDSDSSLYVYQVIRQVQPQIVHVHFGRAGVGCLSIAKHFRIPIVINFYGVETNRRIYMPEWLRRYQIQYTDADAFICSSHAMKEIMIESGCSSDKITVIRCGVDTHFFCGDVTPWMPGQPLQMLSIARLHPDKGLTYLLDACRLLNLSGFRNWQLKIIGRGKASAELKQQAKDHGLQNQVHFLGRQPHRAVRDALRDAHLKILASVKETQGLALQEAQATRTPVIASHTGGIPMGVLDGESGFLFEPQSPPAIVEKIKRFLENPPLFVKMGNAARRYVVAHFSRQEEYRQLSELYRSLLRNQGAPRNFPIWVGDQ